VKPAGNGCGGWVRHAGHGWVDGPATENGPEPKRHSGVDPCKTGGSVMRILILVPFLALGACNVSTDQNNQSLTLQYNQEEAQNTAADVSNTAQNIGAEMSNEADKAATAINNKVGGNSNDNDSNQATNKQ
jgi:hypothetical protein